MITRIKKGFKLDSIYHIFFSLSLSLSDFDLNTILTSGWTALMHSCDSANLEVTELLLDYGVNPKTRKGMLSAD